MRKETKKFEPKVGMMSCVGIGGTKYPLSFGNYMVINTGPYICNMWAENLKEWVKNHPDIGHIEVTIFHDECYGWGDRSKIYPFQIGIITDSRIPQSWLAPTLHRLCVTGHGWGTVAIGKAVHEHLGMEFTDYCGCEDEYTSPSFSTSFVPDDGIKTSTCWNCKKTETIQYKKPMTEEEKSIRDENMKNIKIKFYEEPGAAILDNRRVIEGDFYVENLIKNKVGSGNLIVSDEAMEDIKTWYEEEEDV